MVRKMRTRSRTDGDDAPASAVTAAGEADAALDLIRVKETEIADRLAAAYAEAEAIVARVTLHTKEIAEAAALEAERQAGARIAEIMARARADIVDFEAVSDEARGERALAREARIPRAVDYVVKRVTEM